MNVVPRPSRGLEPDVAAMLLDHHGVGDGEALAGAAADLLGGEERIEHPLLRRLGDPGAGVLDADFGPAARRGGSRR